MSKPVLIGVGGSGQHVVHAYLQLLALSDAPISKIPHVYIIDADAKESTDHPKDSPLTASIRHLHKSLVSPLKDDLEPECRLIRPYFQEHNEIPSKSAISLGVVDTSQPLAHALLMNEEDVDLNDKEVKIGAGMMANARIGSSVFGAKWEDCQLNNNSLDEDKLKNNFGQLFHNVAGARVVIVGSTFGGTGSGVIPALVRILKDKETQAVRAFMTLPWFDIAPSSIGDKSAARKQGDISPMTRNASLGLRTYITELEGNAHSDYVIAQFLGDKPARRDNGNFNQHENTHVFNLMLATAVQQFFERPLARTKGKLLAFVAKGREQQGVVNAASSAHLRLYTGDNCRTLQELMVNTEFVALALEKGAEYITSGFRVEGADTRPEPEGLRLFVNAVFEKMGGTPTVTAGFFGFGGGIPTSSPDAYKKLADNMKTVANRLRFSLCWLDKHKTTAQDRTGLETIGDIRHLFNGNLEPDPLGYETLKDASANESQLKERWPLGGLDNTNYKNKQTDASITGAAKVAQAFTLFTNAFFVENRRTLDHSNSLETQFNAEKDIENKYYIAAQFLAKIIYQEVTLARSHHQPIVNDNNEQSRLMLKGFDDKIDSTAVEGFESLKTLSMSSLQIGDLTNQEHPLSIRHLDPYLGIEHISQLLKQGLNTHPERIFPETAFKGIPNILAPMLLQEWRLNQWNDSAVKQALENNLGKLISTSYGIYLHARRVVEAAFWLLFTQDKRITLIENKEAPQNSKFQKLLNSEFGRKSRKSPTLWIQLAEGKHKGQPVFVYDTAAGWYLAANTAARQFFAEIMPELPTVKYGDGLLEALWRGESYAQAPSLEKQSYDAYVIAAFVRYLINDMTKTIEKIVEQTQTKPLWLQAIKDIASELSPKVKDELAEPTQRLTKKPTGKKLSLAGADHALELEEITELSAFNDLFVESPVYFGSKIRVWPLKGMAWQHIEPYTVEEAAKEAKAFTVTETKKSDGNGSRSEWRWDEIRFKLKVKDKNLGEISYKNHPKLKRIAGIDNDDNFAWSTAIWPNFEAKQWTYYLAGGDSGAVAENELKNIDLKGTSLRGDCLEFVFYGDIYATTNDATEHPLVSTFGEIGRVKNNVPIKLNGVPRCAEICFGGAVLGSIPIQLTHKAEADTANQCSVALDFGTSNTCMALSITSNNAAEPRISTLPLFEGELFNDATALKSNLTWAAGSLVSSGKYNHQQLPTLFFQSFNQLASADRKPRSIPSELLFVSGVANSVVRKNIKLDGDKGYLGRHDIKGKYKTYALLERFGSVNDCCLEGGRPVVVPLWTPFPPAIDEALRRELISASTTESDRVENFKWPSANVHYAYRAAYLESILVASFATLRINGYSSIQKLIGTYPGAFDEAHKNGYFGDLNKISEKLSKQCGVALQLPQVVKRSETVAGLVGCHRNHGDISLTIDMGGGTTDIGFIIPKATPNRSPDETPDAYMSSLRYAGTHLLAAIVGQSFAVNGEEKSDVQKRIDLLNMKLKIREGRSDLTFGEEANSRYKLITEAFFRGLFEYVLNLVSAFTRQTDFPSQGNINLYFLGNGCNLVDVFCQSTVQTLFQTVCNEAIASGLLTDAVKNRFVYPSLDEHDKKQMLIKGALHDIDFTNEGQQYQHIENQGHGGRAIWLPCIKYDNRLSQQVTLGSLDANDDSHPLLCPAEDESLKSSFGLTHKYWQAVQLDLRKLVSLVPTSEFKDFGKYYLEKKFVTEVLCKLTKEPVVEKAKPKPAAPTSAPSPQQSGFKPASVSESITAPNTSPPQNPSNATDPVKLSSGGNILINGNNITITLNWQSPFELDVIVFALNDKGKVTADENTIFYNQPNYAQGAVQLNNELRQVHIDLRKIPTDIKTIAICAVTGIDDESARGKNFGQVSHSAINVSAQNNITFELSHVKGTETAMIFGEVYRHQNIWKFRAKGQGYAGGFKKMCDEYGAEY